MNQKVIIAEDEEGLRSLYKEIIDRTFPGLQVDLVTNGADLVAKVRQENYDLILSDDNMPTMNGLEAYLTLRSEGRAIPNYFLITTIQTPRREKEIRSAGITCIEKPLNIRTLKTIVEKSLTSTDQIVKVTNLTFRDQLGLDYQI